MIEARLRTKISEEELQEKVGKILTADDVNVVLRGKPVALYKPDGKLLLKYLPGHFAPERMAEFYDVLHSLKKFETDNRGLASGTIRTPKGQGTRTRSMPVASMVAGAMDAAPPKNYCRLTAWSGKDWEQYASLFPLFQDIGAEFARQVPDRYEVQMDYVKQTADDWVITGTPFTTITVNNTYPTGVHTDKGDLAAGFSTLAVLRRGEYAGGWLCFPEFRVGVDMQDGDLLLMDAHEWHGNTALALNDPTCYICDKAATRRVSGTLAGYASSRTWALCDEHCAWTKRQPNFAPDQKDIVVSKAERISVVCYYREKMKECGNADEEAKKALDWAEHRIAINAEAVEEMAIEATGA